MGKPNSIESAPTAAYQPSTKFRTRSEGLIAEIVVQSPGAQRVIDAARKTVGLVVERGKQIIRIGPDIAAPVARRAEKVGRARSEEGSAVGRAIVVEVEAQVVGRVQREVGRAKLPDCRPIVIASQARKTEGQDHSVVLVPIVVTLPPVDAEIVELVLRHRQLRRREGIASEAARR